MIRNSVGCLLCCCWVLGGCASAKNPKDPFESYNRTMYQFNEVVDKAVIKPAAQGYSTVIPPPVRMMVSNFFSNLNDVVVTVNDLLQFKLKQAVSDSGRIAVNSTFGLLGVADVATSLGMEKHHEDFGQTLGHWGFGSGPYVVLPVIGPSSVRDTFGEYGDIVASPLRKVNNVDSRNEAFVLNLVNKRSKILDKEELLDEAALDRYDFIRDAYLERRQNQINGDRPVRRKYDDEDDDSSDKGAAPAPASAPVGTGKGASGAPVKEPADATAELREKTDIPPLLRTAVQASAP